MSCFTRPNDLQGNIFQLLRGNFPRVIITTYGDDLGVEKDGRERGCDVPLRLLQYISGEIRPRHFAHHHDPIRSRKNWEDSFVLIKFYDSLGALAALVD